MRIVVNGNEQMIDPGVTVAALIAQCALQPKQVAVEINRDLVPRRAFETTELKDGDEVEVVTLVGGG